MKQKEKTIALGLALLVLLGAWLLAESMSGRFQKDVPAEEGAEPILLAAGTAADIDGLAWIYGDQRMELVWAEERDAWVNGADYACPIDPQKVEPLLTAVSGVQADMAIQRVRDFAQYGLETPILTVTVTTADHAVVYEIGNQTLTGEYYLRVDGTDTVYTETGLLLPAFQVSLGDLLAMGSGPEDVAQVTELAVQTDVTDYVLSYGEPSGDTWLGGTCPWSARVDGGEPIPLETESAEGLYELVTAIEFMDCVDWREEARQDYGLETPQGTATVTYETAAEETETFSLLFGSYEGAQIYVQIGGADEVYLVDGSVLDRLMYPAWETMTPWTIGPVDMEIVSGVSVSLGGHEYEIERHVEAEETVAANGDLVTEERVYYVSNGWTLDTEAAEAWFERLGALEALGFAGEAQGREEQITVTFYRDSETWSEVTFSIWSYDSARSLCRVNGEESYFIGREAGEELVAQGEALLVIE